MWVKDLSKNCSYFSNKRHGQSVFFNFSLYGCKCQLCVCSVIVQDLFLWMSVCADYMWQLCLLFGCGKDGVLSLVPVACNEHDIISLTSLCFIYQPVLQLPACVTVTSYQLVLQWQACVTVTSLCFTYQPVLQLPACVTSCQPVLELPVTSLCYSDKPVLQLPQLPACVIVASLCYSYQPVLQLPQLPVCVTVTSLCYSYQHVLHLPAWVTVTWCTSLYNSYHSYQPVL